VTDWPENLVRDIARRRCVIVAGSGVSSQAVGDGGAKPPTWKTFLRNCNNNCPDGPHKNITTAIEECNLLAACEWLQKKFDDRWTEQLRNAFSAPRFAPAEVHKDIARLDSRIVFSLNFEDILDRAMQDVYSGTCVTKRYFDDGVSEFLRGTDRYLVKVHGSLDETDKIIFTQRQYAEARVKSAAFYNAFDSALMTHTFLFLGTGHQDPDINLVLENQNFTYNQQHPHYFLAAQGMHSDQKESLRTNRNLQVIEYDAVDDDYSGFPPAIAELVTKVETARQELAEKQEW